MRDDAVHCAGEIGGVLWQCGRYVREERLEKEEWRWFLAEDRWRCKWCARGEGDRRKDAAFLAKPSVVTSASGYHPVSGTIDQYIPWMAPK